MCDQRFFSFYMCKTIFVVDDDEGILTSIKAILELEGYKVITQNQNCKKLHEIICSSSPQLILLDVVIAEHDGRIICRKLKTDKTISNIPIILVSAHIETADNYADYGADGFIAKPFDVDELLYTIENEISKPTTKGKNN